MRRQGLALVLLAAVTGGLAEANAPTSSLRPVSREDVFPVALPSFAPDRSLRPMLRPKTVEQAARRTGPVVTVGDQPNAAAVSVAQPRKQATTTKVGKICRDRKLQGLEVGNVPGKLNGCGIRKGAVKLYSVGDVTLSQPAVMECDTAKALKSWVEGGMDKAVGRYGRGVVELKVAAGYSCRTRNSKPGAKISEHGKGRAIDISGFKLKNGDTISVLNDWDKGKKGRILKEMHQKACGPFGTVLGPNADRHHQDHFHFDIAKHGNGSYCR